MYPFPTFGVLDFQQQLLATALSNPFAVGDLSVLPNPIVQKETTFTITERIVRCVCNSYVLLDEQCAIFASCENFHRLYNADSGCFSERCNFTSLLAPESAYLNSFLRKLAGKKVSSEKNIQLTFLRDTQLIPTFCSIIALPYTPYVLLELQNLWETEIGSSDTVRKPTLGVEDIALLQRVHTFIISNLGEPLPSPQKLAHLFGISENKLKDGFRSFFNTSLHHFYIDERLKKAHVMIQETDSPLIEIADACGYGDYPHFSKEFKKRFGYAPRVVRKLGRQG